MTRALLLSLFLLAACAPPQAAPGLKGALSKSLTLTHDGKERRYHLYENGQGPRPLVLLLHGGGADIDNHIGLAKRWPHQVWLDIADEEGLIVVAPQGLNSQWNDCRVECERCGKEDDFGFLMRLLDDVSARHEVDPERIYVVGESNGGFMTQRLAVEAPERFAAMGVVIAQMPKNSACTARKLPMSLMYQVGTEDAAIPFEGGSRNRQIHVLSARESLDYWRGVNVCEGDPVTQALPDLDPEDKSTVTREDHTCAATGTALSLLTMRGAGHVAPSVEVQVSGLWEGIAGIQNHDIEGARVFWAFFKDKRRRANATPTATP